MIPFMRALRFSVALALLVIQLRPFGAVLSCAMKTAAPAAACEQAMDGMGNGAVPSVQTAVTSATHGAGGCVFAALCAAPVPALLRSAAGIPSVTAMVDYHTPDLYTLSPGDSPAPATQPPRI